MRGKYSESENLERSPERERVGAHLGSKTGRIKKESGTVAPTTRQTVGGHTDSINWPAIKLDWNLSMEFWFRILIYF